MNCKPGELAIVVRAKSFIDDPVVGRIVRVTTLTTANWAGRPRWLFEGPALSLANGERVNALCDDALRPIRPGDISNEEVRDLYAPKIPEAA